MKTWKKEMEKIHKFLLKFNVFIFTPAKASVVLSAGTRLFSRKELFYKILVSSHLI